MNCTTCGKELVTSKAKFLVGSRQGVTGLLAEGDFDTAVCCDTVYMIESEPVIITPPTDIIVPGG